MNNMYASKIEIWLKKLWCRLTVCFKVLFVWDHWFIVPMKRQDLYSFFNNDTFDLTFYKHGLQDYNVYALIKKIAETKDEDDMISMKADFESYVELHSKATKKKK